jgi:lysophospholipase L1-like esterase
MSKLIATLVAVVFVFGGKVTAQQTPVDPNRWEPEIQQFEAIDKQTRPVKGGIVFIGSSSIARWKNLAESFPDLQVVNRGFGGSELADSAKYANRVVVPHAPRIVVLYAGENDLNRGVSPKEISGEFAKFAGVIRSSLPATRLVVVGLKPSLARWHLREGMHATNTLIRTTCEGYKSCTYVDVWPSMLGKDGKPKPEFFVEDGLHMTPEGYNAWTQVLRPHLK